MNIWIFEYEYEYEYLNMRQGEYSFSATRWMMFELQVLVQLILNSHLSTAIHWTSLFHCPSHTWYVWWKTLQRRRAAWTRSRHGSWKILCNSLHHTSQIFLKGHCYRATFLRCSAWLSRWGNADPQEVHPWPIRAQQLQAHLESSVRLEGAGEGCQWADVSTLTIERTPAGKSIRIPTQPLDGNRSSEGDLGCTDRCWSG